MAAWLLPVLGVVSSLVSAWAQKQGAMGQQAAAAANAVKSHDATLEKTEPTSSEFRSDAVAQGIKPPTVDEALGQLTQDTAPKGTALSGQGPAPVNTAPSKTPYQEAMIKADQGGGEKDPKQGTSYGDVLGQLSTYAALGSSVQDAMRAGTPPPPGPVNFGSRAQLRETEPTSTRFLTSSQQQRAPVSIDQLLQLLGGR